MGARADAPQSLPLSGCVAALPCSSSLRCWSLGRAHLLNCGAPACDLLSPSESCRCNLASNGCGTKGVRCSVPTQWPANYPGYFDAGRRTGTLIVWCLCLTGRGRQPSRSVQSWGCLTGRAWSKTGGRSSAAVRVAACTHHGGLASMPLRQAGRPSCLHLALHVAHTVVSMLSQRKQTVANQSCATLALQRLVACLQQAVTGTCPCALWIAKVFLHHDRSPFFQSGLPRQHSQLRHPCLDFCFRHVLPQAATQPDSFLPVMPAADPCKTQLSGIRSAVPSLSC